MWQHHEEAVARVDEGVSVQLWGSRRDGKGSSMSTGWCDGDVSVARSVRRDRTRVADDDRGGGFVSGKKWERTQPIGFGFSGRRRGTEEGMVLGIGVFGAGQRE